VKEAPGTLIEDGSEAEAMGIVDSSSLAAIEHQLRRPLPYVFVTGKSSGVPANYPIESRPSRFPPRSCHLGKSSSVSAITAAL
jgi:hypothetical protein